MQLRNFSLAAWDKPWRSEIDWLDSYVNLSSLSQGILEGLFTGYSLTKDAKYYAYANTGCWMYFDLDLELAKIYYYYGYTNRTMLICSPYLLMRPDVYSDFTKHDDFVVFCFDESAFLEGTLKYILKTQKLALSLVFSAAVVIILTGLTG